MPAPIPPLSDRSGQVWHEIEESSSFRTVPQERNFVSCTETFQQILDSITRQETALRNINEDQVLMQSAMQHHHDTVCDKLNKIQQNSSALSFGTGAFDRQCSDVDACLKVPVDIPDNVVFVSTASPEPQLETKQIERETKKVAAVASSPMSIVAKAKAVKRVHAENTKPEESAEVAVHWLILHCKEFFHSPLFELVMGCVIILNMSLLAVQFQCEGRYAAHAQLGLYNDGGPWNDVQVAFETLEVIFNLLYLIELIARLFVYRWEYFSHTFNILDGAIVTISCIDSFIVQPLQDGMGGLNLAILRIFRICRIFRVQKILRYTEHMGEMRVIIETLILSIQGLFWSALLMAVVIISVAVLMVQLSLAFLDDESIELERRQWLYLKFGTTARACYTMFECTFSSGWHKYSRPMIEEFSSAFGIFWCLYIVGVNFAMVRVIAAIFLKQIMFVAALDEKRKAKEMEQEREKVAADLREIFALADTSHNGAISKHEFDMMLQDHKVLSFLEKIGLEIEDAVALFNMMSLDDGEADYTEFLNGASNMKSQARAIDVVQVLHRQVEMGRELNVIAENIRALKKL